MWRFAFLAPLLAAGSDLPSGKDNSTTTAADSSTSLSRLIASSTPSSIVTTPYGTQDVSTLPSSTHSLGLSSSLLSSTVASSDTSRTLSATAVSLSSASSSATVSSNDSSSSSPITTSATTWTLTKLSNSSSSANSTAPSSSTSPHNATITGLCTGCVLQAQGPMTTFFIAEEQNSWTSIVVTATVVTSFITYLINNATIDTIVTESQTVNQTQTLTLTDSIRNITLSHQTPVFSVTPTPGVVLTLEAGPTYVIYGNLYGGLERPLQPSGKPLSSLASNTCRALPTRLSNWQPKETDDWKYFIDTYSQGLPPATGTTKPVRLPSAAIEYLKNDLAIQSQFQGSDIATCTQIFEPPDADRYPVRPTSSMGIRPPGAPILSAIPAPSPIAPPVAPAPGASTAYGAPVWTKTTGTWLTTSYETTSTYVTRNGPLRSHVVSPYDPVFSGEVIDDPGVTHKGDNQVRPTDTPQGSGQPGNGNDVGKAQQSGITDNQPPPGVPIVIGGSTYTATPIKPTPPPGQPNGQDAPPAPIVIGTHTITPGGSADIDGHNVFVPLPTPGGGSNPNVVVDGVTRTLVTAPIITPPPVLSVGGRPITATVVSGTTQYAIGSQLLIPGSSLVLDGTTFALPAAAGNIVVNGVTSTLNPAQSSFLLGQQFVTASVSLGTTSFVFNPSQTLTPGGAVTVSGTTFSMPLSASGSVVVINGATSTLPPGPSITAFVLTINGKTYTATTRAGTTEFVLAQGVTLRPGEAVTISGTTYSLDGRGTALVVNGVTSSVARGPARNSASTTASASASARDVGNFVWSGIGGGGGGSSSSSTGGGAQVRAGGIDKWVEGLVVGFAGWVLLL